jgi:hypothetical protein
MFITNTMQNHLNAQFILIDRFDAFLMTIDSHIDSDYSYFNKHGEVPEHCILSTKYSVLQTESN